MKAFILQSEGQWSEIFENRSEHDSYDEAVEAAGKRFDAGDEGDFRVVENKTGKSWRMTGHTLLKCSCPECGAEIRIRDAFQTYDCHGIPFRRVCRNCDDKIMNDRGFDGEEYSDADERIDYDY